MECSLKLNVDVQNGGGIHECSLRGPPIGLVRLRGSRRPGAGLERPDPLVRGGLRRRIGPHRLRRLAAPAGRFGPGARALVRGVVPPPRRRGDPHDPRGDRAARRGRLRRDPRRGSALLAGDRRRRCGVGRHLRAAPATAVRLRHLPRPRPPRERADPGRPARPADAIVRRHRDRADGPGAPVAGAPRAVGEHADGAARLQRDLAEDDGGLGPRLGPLDDVHGAVRAGREGGSARPPARGGLPHPRGRGRRDLRRRDLPDAAGRHRLGRRRLRPLVPGHGSPGALARDAVAADAGASRLPVPAGLGLPHRTAGEDA
jgi:hypothetical protein